jgi:hypothetical protein
MFTVPLRVPGAETAAARVMAGAWSAYYAALLSGDPSASAFAEWLASYWQPALERPAGASDAHSPLAAGPESIDWFERDGWVSGHIAGQRGGYRVPRADVLAYPWVTLVESAA